MHSNPYIEDSHTWLTSPFLSDVTASQQTSKYTQAAFTLRRFLSVATVWSCCVMSQSRAPRWSAESSETERSRQTVNKAEAQHLKAGFMC